MNQKVVAESKRNSKTTHKCAEHLKLSSSVEVQLPGGFDLCESCDGPALKLR